MATKHHSNSKTQLDVEAHVLKQLGLVPFKPAKHQPSSIDGIRFNFDGYCKSDRKVTIAEVYARIGKLKPGHKRKLTQDVLKMILYDKLTRGKCKKVIVLVDPEVRDFLDWDVRKSWLNRAIREYDVELKLVELPEDLKAELVKAIDLQGKAFRNK